MKKVYGAMIELEQSKQGKILLNPAITVLEVAPFDHVVVVFQEHALFWEIKLHLSISGPSTNPAAAEGQERYRKSAWWID